MQCPVSLTVRTSRTDAAIPEKQIPKVDLETGSRAESRAARDSVWSKAPLPGLRLLCGFRDTPPNDRLRVL